MDCCCKHPDRYRCAEIRDQMARGLPLSDVFLNRQPGNDPCECSCHVPEYLWDDDENDRDEGCPAK